MFCCTTLVGWAADTPMFFTVWLNNGQRAEFNREIGEVEERWFATLENDVSAFCRSFDYRAEEPLTEEQKTAVERAVKGLSGLEGREVKPC